MLIVSKKTQRDLHKQARKGLTDHFNKEMEKILNENSHTDNYWILGKVRFPEELGGKVGRTFLQASAVQPPLVKDSFVYQVDNRRGVKELMWVLYPNGVLYIPRLGKSIQASKPQKLQNSSPEIGRLIGRSK